MLAGVATLALVWRRPLRAGALQRRARGGGDHRRLGARPAAGLPAGADDPAGGRPHDTLVAIVIASWSGGHPLPVAGPPVPAGARGSARLRRVNARCDDAEQGGHLRVRPGLLARSAGACLIAGLGFLTAADAGWAHAVGVAALFAFIVLGFLAVAPAELARRASTDASIDSG